MYHKAKTLPTSVTPVKDVLADLPPQPQGDHSSMGTTNINILTTYIPKITLLTQMLLQAGQTFNLKASLDYIQ